MTSKLHGMAGGLALALIASFLGLTLWSEFFGSEAQIVAVKTGIMWAVFALLPLLAATGASGFRLSRERLGKLVARKQLRMKVVAANGLLILLPAALFLGIRAGSGQFDIWFYGVQLVEIVAGVTNLLLLALNFRDGLKLSPRRRTNPIGRKSPRHAAASVTGRG